MMFVELMLKALNIAINRYIKLDSFYRNKLKSLAGKYIQIHLTEPDMNLTIGFYESHIVIQKNLLGDADLLIETTPVNLLRLLCEDNTQHLLSKNLVDVKGDIHLAQNAAQFFKAIKIDWPRYLKPILGDAANGQISKWREQANDYCKTHKSRLMDDTEEYLQEEMPLFPNREEYEEWKTAISALRDDVARLEAKINWQQSQTGAH